MRIAFNNMFFDKKKMAYSTGSQTSFAIPLYFGMVNREYRELMLKNLTEKIRQGNNALTSGDVGYRYLLQALHEAGYSDIIYKAKTSWDDVFGKPHPKGTRANDEREKAFNAFLVWKRVREENAEGHPIDENLFTRIGRELGLGGKTKTAELYYFFQNTALKDKSYFFNMIDPHKLLCK